MRAQPRGEAVSLAVWSGVAAVAGVAFIAVPEPAAAQVREPTARMATAVPARVAESIELVLGEIRMLPVRGKVRRIAVGNGANLSATTVDTNLLLIGEQPGATTLMVWTDREILSYRVSVVPPSLVSTRRLLDTVLQGVDGVTVTESDSRLYVSGIVDQPLLDRMSVMLKDSPGVVLDLRTEAPRPVTRSVLFRVHFVEVAKSLLENIGIQWQQSAQGPTLAGQGTVATSGIYRGLPPATAGDNLLNQAPAFVSRNGRESGLFLGLASVITSRINLGATDGDARILASPELTAKSGGKARLQVGGEVPIPIAGAFGSTSVEFKPYGIIFSIEPVISSDGVIFAKLSTELSQIDPAVSVAGIPGFLTRSTATEISVRPGEMIALSGLINNELSNAIDRVPGLGGVPILGRLFRSDAYRTRKTDLVVLLEPEIIDAGDGLSRIRDRGLKNTEEFRQRLESPPPLSPIPPPPDIDNNALGR